jgi:predicted permease
MFLIFLKTTFRSLWKNKTYSFLNIFGLAIGITCAGLIFLWVEDETNFDSVYTKKDQLYTIRENQTYDGVTRTFISTPGPMAAAIKAEVPGIANTCRMNHTQLLFSKADKAIYERGCYTDSSFFSMFTMQFVQGSIKDVFRETNSLVITQKMANRFFGDEQHVVGKTLLVDNNQQYLITGVVKDVPANTTLQYDWFIPYDVYGNTRPWIKNWGSNGTNTYVELVPGASLAAINKQLFDFIEKKQAGATSRSFLFAMKDWRLRDNFEGGKQTGGRIEFVKMFTVIAWIILLIACINFMNLATARSEKRAREVGVRKVMGADKKRLILRFIGEALCMSFLAVFFGVILIMLVLPSFNVLVEKQLTIGLNQPLHAAAVVAVALLCGCIAGSYPAIYLSSFNPVSVLKGMVKRSPSASLIRKGLVVFQFGISIVLIISTVIIYQQVQHVKTRDLGYDKNNLVSVDIHADMIRNFSVIRQDLLNTGLIENAGLSSYNTLYVGNNGSGYTWKGYENAANILISNRQVSPELIPTLGLKLLEGRGFNPDIASDSNHIIITASLAKMMGKAPTVGKTIYDGKNQLTVIGVVNDFIYGDMYGKSDPIIFSPAPERTKYLFVRLKSQFETGKSLAALGAVLQKHNPAYPFVYSFVDDQFNQMFTSETLIGKLSRLFAALAILISCLGLFGLSAYTAERRTKEIGIRKVLGASVTGITGLLTKDFMILVLLSALIAFPVAWWAMTKWLQGYAYRIDINWWVFVLAGATAMLIALVTISFQSVKAALSNPVKSLRTE